MRKTIKITFSVIAFIIAVMLTVMSASSGGKIVLVSIILIAFGGFVISLTYAAWTNKAIKTAFLNSLELSFGVSSFIVILGYLYTALQPIILK
jgi:hypothetical protein